MGMGTSSVTLPKIVTLSGEIGLRNSNIDHRDGTYDHRRERHSKNGLQEMVLEDGDVPILLPFVYHFIDFSESLSLQINVQVFEFPTDIFRAYTIKLSVFGCKSKF